MAMLESSFTAESSIEKFIANSPLFYSLSPNVLRSIASKVQVVTFEPDQNIVQQGDIGDSFYIIKEGRVHVLQASDGHEIILSQLGESEGFGEMSLIIDQPRTATVRALSKTIALKLSKTDFSSLMRKWPELAAKMYRLVDERVSLVEELDSGSKERLIKKQNRSFVLEYADLNMLMQLNYAAGGDEQMEHCYEVGQLAREMSRILCPMLCEEILFAGYLHEIGKVALPRQLVSRYRKADNLSPEEEVKVSKIFEHTVAILEPYAELAEALAFIKELGQDDYRQMSLEAQVLKVADDYLELSSYVCLHLSLDEALARIREKSGTLYNPRVVAALEKNVRLFADVRIHSQLNVMRMMVKALDIKDNYTFRHSMDVRDMSLMIADRLKVSKVEREYMRISAELHDVGKIFIDEEVLNAPRKLTEQEFDLMKTHAARSGELFRNVPGMDELVLIVRAHHEKWNGTGYPDGLQGEEIPFLARIMTIADVWSALTTPRVYRLDSDGNARKFSPEKALSIMQEMADGHFDPTFFPIFESIIKEQFINTSAKEQSLA